MQDIETIMIEIAEIMKLNIPLKIVELATEKGDALLGTSDNLGEINYTDAAYYTWQLNQIAPYPLAFLQFIEGDPELWLTDDGSDCAKRYTIGIAAVIAETGKSTTPQAQARIGRILEEIIREELTGRYKPAEIVRIRSTVLRDPNSNLYLTAEILFTIDLI